MAELSFRSLFCGHFNCPTSDYETRALKEFLYWHARLLRSLLPVLRPGIFDEDLRLIRDLAETTDWRSARAELQTYADLNREEAGFLRAKLKLRISGRAASRVAIELFSNTATGSGS